MPFVVGASEAKGGDGAVPVVRADHHSSLAAFALADPHPRAVKEMDQLGDLLDMVAAGRDIGTVTAVSPPPPDPVDALSAAVTRGAHGPSHYPPDGVRVVVDATGDKVRRTGLRGAGEVLGEGKRFTVVTHVVPAGKH